MSQNYTGRVLAILVVLFVAVFGFPGCASMGGIFNLGALFKAHATWAEKLNLKPGIDIAGGTKLLYEIIPPSGGYHQNGGQTLAEEMAAALKKRVDPNGVRNLIWRPEGNTRIEIQIPRSPSSDIAAAAREKLTEATEELENTNVRSADVLDAIQNATGAQRDQRLDDLADGSLQRIKLFSELKTSYDQWQKSAREYHEAQAKKDQKEMSSSADAAALAEIQFNKLQTQIEDQNLTVAQLENTLDIPKPSDRDKKFDELRKDYAAWPQRLKAINDYAESYLKAQTVKGVIDDASELKRLLQGSGVLEFHILVLDPGLVDQMRQRFIPHGERPAKGPAPEGGDIARWYEVTRPEEMRSYDASMATYNGRRYALAYITPDQEMVHRPNAPSWSLTRAYPTQGENGEQVVGFEFDAQGARLFGDLTGRSINKPLAIVLDDKIISAPNIKSQINQYGTIDGGARGYTQPELTYLVDTLNAGSLPATLSPEPISEQTVSPSFGSDNLHAALSACWIGLAVVGVFLISYYYIAGIVAFCAVLMNLLIILGVLAMFNATFTLPSIAGIVLTVGTAIDANVLVFERLREEEHHGLPLKLAVRHAFERAQGAIIDSNATTIITSMVLFFLGSEEVKGFGLTLLIGICSSLFTALFCTKTALGILVERFGVKRLGSLPLTFPAWDRLLKPNIDWMKYIWPFVAFSVIFISTGLSAFVVYQRDMYDIEFASGTSVQFELRQPASLPEVRSWLAPQEKAGKLPSFNVVSINNSLTTYELVTPNDKAPVVRDALLTALGDRLKTELPSKFEMAGAKLDEALHDSEQAVTQPSAGAGTAPATQSDEALAASSGAPVVLPITSPTMKIDRAEVPDAAANIGGVAIVLRNLSPPISPEEIRRRIDRASGLLPTAQTGARQFEVVRLDGEPKKIGYKKPASEAVVLVTDPNFPYDKNPSDWREYLAQPVWSLVNEGVDRPASLDKVNNFDPQVAGDTRRVAIMATIISVLLIMAYIWVRFGNLKYGSATVVALIHDTLVTIGAIGLTHYLANRAVGNALLLEPFRINLTLVAAILTVMSYSMIDTIVVFDRIRENRGKYGVVTRKVINDSVNQTLSRTLLTAGTTLVMVGVMYICGGPGIHGFTFVLLVGILFGTYSSVAIASPILLLGKEQSTATAKHPAAGAAAPGKVVGA